MLYETQGSNIGHVALSCCKECIVPLEGRHGALGLQKLDCLANQSGAFLGHDTVPSLWVYHNIFLTWDDKPSESILKSGDQTGRVKSDFVLLNPDVTVEFVRR
jgi:hypothetical protein